MNTCTMTIVRNARIARIAFDQYTTIDGLDIDELQDLAVEKFYDRVCLNVDWQPATGEITGDVDVAAEFVEMSAADEDFEPEEYLLSIAEQSISDAIAELCE